MPLIRTLVSAWRSLFHQDRLDGELDAELAAYFDELVDRKIRAGADPAAARRAALVEMDGIESVRQEVRRGRIGRNIASTLGDVRHAWRGVLRAPGVAFVIVATLALGIGANTAIFSIVHAMLIAPLPFRDPSRLVFVWSDMSTAGYPRAPLSGPELNDLRERGALFAGFGAIWSNSAALDGEPEPEQLRIGLVTTDFFPVLGADAALGRVFAPEDAMQGSPATILLTDRLWRRRYGADPNIVGRQVRVNGTPTTIIGVMAPDFRLLMPPDAAVPDDLQAWLPFDRNLVRGPRGQKFLRVVGRMKPGVTLQQARDEVDAIAAQISREFTEYGVAGRQYHTVALQADGVREMRGSLLALFAGVAILLLIACVNVASILTSRAASRSSETALRLALGSGMPRLFRLYLAEGLMLSALGGAAGLLVAELSLRLMLLFIPASLGRLAATEINVTVLAFTSLIALVWGVLFSLAPLAEARRTSLTTPLQTQSSRVTGLVQQRTRATLVAAELALGVVLLVSTGLMVKTFVQMLRVDPGFESAGSLTFRVALPGRFARPNGFNAFHRVLQEKLSAMPGVTGVGTLSHVPFDSLPNWGGPYRSHTMQNESILPFGDYRAVSPGAMEALNVRLIEGRFFTEQDDPKSQLVAIVDDQLARRAWPGERAIGQQIWADPFSRGQAAVPATVVGVVAHLRHRSLVEDLGDQVYFPQRQILRNPIAYVVSAAGNPADLAGPVRQLVTALDPELPIYDIRPLDEYANEARAARRFTMALAAVFAAVALALASVGVYGVIAYSVVRRRAEFGVRLALGAEPRQIVRLAMREGVRSAAIGLAIGVATAAAVAPFLQGQLFGVTPRDPASYLAAALLLGLSAAIASWLPARRAAGLSPLDALRTDA